MNIKKNKKQIPIGTLKCKNNYKKILKITCGYKIYVHILLRLS